MEVFIVAVMIICVILLTAAFVTFKHFSEDYFDRAEFTMNEIKSLQERYTAAEKSLENIGKAAADALERSQEVSNNFELLKALNKR